MLYQELIDQQISEDFLYNISLMTAVDEAMIAMLDSGNHETVFVACGVLMNLMADEEKRPKLLQHGGVSKYVQVL